MEDDLKGRRPQGKNTYMEDYLKRSPPHWKPYRKQMQLACLTSQFSTELVPAQPQLVLPIYYSLFMLSMFVHHSGHVGHNEQDENFEKTYCT